MNECDATNGFCIFNNVCVGASYLKYNYLKGNKIAIFDFDFHQGNGTECIIKALQPGTMDKEFEFQFGSGTFKVQQWKPWYGYNDYNEVLFISVHA